MIIIKLASQNIHDFMKILSQNINNLRNHKTFLPQKFGAIR